ncbi:MAG TPA: hypothetical protein VN380_20015 [Thermoanaerobaculia bacterium]|jgi:hypothetical protein|nr:hypothetical protein [Thermoanaerobaculia bacterium]
MRFILFLTLMTGFIISGNHSSFITRHMVVISDQGPGIDPDGRNTTGTGGTGVTPDAGPRIDPEG